MGSDEAKPAPPPSRQQRVRLSLETNHEDSEAQRIVNALLMDGQAPNGGVDRETAAQVLDVLASLELPKVFADIVEGGERLAEQIHSQAARSLQEVIQNAEDQSASWIRFAVRRRGRNAELLIAHDGNAVDFGDVVAMTFPLVSRSREDPERIGRFGIGLKTLNQFGRRLQVHCPPLPSFELRDGSLERIDDARGVPGLWDPAARQTLFVLTLDDERFDASFFQGLLRAWDASALVFLRHLRSVSFVHLPTREAQIEHRIVESRRDVVELALPRALDTERVELREASSKRRWTVYRTRYPVPRDLRRINKALGTTVPLAVSVCDKPGSATLYAGLPLDELGTDHGARLPFALAAPFDVNVERTTALNHAGWNDWLIDRCGDLVAAAAQHAFAADPRRGWQWIPVTGESVGEPGTRLAERIDAMCSRVRSRTRERVRVQIGNEQLRLTDLLVEDAALSPLFTPDELERLHREATPSWKPETTHRSLPRRARDAGGRWRAILANLDGAGTLTVEDALRALEWPDKDLADRRPSWLVELMAAALANGLAAQLRELSCVLVEGSEISDRMSPGEISDRGRMLVSGARAEGLAAALGLAERIHPAFRARSGAAVAVCIWLISAGVLFERASEHDAMVALAAGDGDDPLDLAARPQLARQLRSAFEQLPAEERERLGGGIGRNILLAGYEYDARGRRQSCSVTPTAAYLPAGIEKLEGWPRAAGRVPGLAWIDDRYAEWLRTRRDERGAVRRRGVVSFLRDLGAWSGPRLQPGPPPIGDPQATLPTRRLTPHQREQLRELPAARTLRDDWDSPDLAMVLRDIVAERPIALRRRRARALVVCLMRNWSHQYAGRAVAQAAHHLYRWYDDGAVATTWIGRLASEPWMSTRARRFTPAAPRDLAVATSGTFGITGDEPGSYASELEPEDADAPLLEAIGVAGRPTMETILAQLEELRSRETSGEAVRQTWVDRCYGALAAYCPGGEHGTDADLDRAQMRARFGVRPGRAGLIRVNDRWQSIGDVRQGPYLGRRLSWVEHPRPLWDHLEVSPSNLADCIHLFDELATTAEADEATEILTLRRLVELAPRALRARRQLAALRLRTSQGWLRASDGPIYAVRDRVLAAAVGDRWPVWTPPLALAEVAPLVAPLGLHVLDRDAVAPDVPSASAVANDMQAEFGAIVTYFANYLVRNAPLQHDSLPQDRWHALMEADVVLGPSWALRVRAPGRRTLRVQPRAYMCGDPMLLCALDAETAGRHDAGGEAIASFVLGADSDGSQAEAHSLVTLAWEIACRNHGEAEQAIDTAAPAPAPDDGAELPRHLGGRRAPTRSPARRLPSRRKEPPRELVDADALDLASVACTVVEDGRGGKLRVRARAPLRSPRPPGAARQFASTRAGDMRFSSSEREELGLRIAIDYLAAHEGLELEDVRSDRNVGADAIDRTSDIWVELKTAGRDHDDTVRLEASEAARAKQKGKRYWLVVVSGLEKPRTPRLLIVKDPLARLDVSLAHGIKLAGLSSLA